MKCANCGKELGEEFFICGNVNFQRKHADDEVLFCSEHCFAEYWELEPITKDEYDEWKEL